MMSLGTALIAILLVSLLPDSFAIDYCFHRVGTTTSTSNGTAILCTGLPYCYSYTQYRYGQYHHAACTSDTNVCSGYPSCVVCSTDYCNSVTPSSITCKVYEAQNYFREQNCSTGVSNCHVYSSDGWNILGGCGSCSGISSRNCRACNTSLCNSALPPVINCYSRMSSLDTYDGPGDAVACQNGIPTCFSLTEGDYTHAGCGICHLTSGRSCITCSSNLCNTHLPSSISCFQRNGMYVHPFTSPGRNGTLTQCSTGVTTCYTYREQWWSSKYRDYSGCGVCNGSDLFCTNCNSSGCNYFTNYFHVQTTGRSSISTITMPSAPTTITGGTTTSQSPITAASISATATTPKSTGNRPFTMKCYFTFGETDHSKRAKVTCTSSSCFQFSFNHGTTDHFFAGCGNCSVYSGLFINCQTCFDDYCNSGQNLIVGAKLQVAACVFSLIVMLMNKELI